MAKYIIWLRSEVVAEVRFAEWTHGGILRHAEVVVVREDVTVMRNDEAIFTTEVGPNKQEMKT